jgi:hypothetical protein
MVLADSRKISLVPRYSGYLNAITICAYGAITRYGPTFQKVLLDVTLYIRSYNPKR